MKLYTNCLILIFLITYTTSAETVMFKNGDRISASLVEQTNDTIYITSEILGNISVSEDQIKIETNNLPDYYHPGKGGTISFVKNPNNYFASFGELHPNIISQLDIKTNALIGFELNLDKYVKLKEKNQKSKISYKFSEFQKSERDFAFIVDKNIQAQELLNLIKNVNVSLIKTISVFDLYEGEKIEADKKSLGVTVFLQPKLNTFSEEDLEGYSRRIIQNVSSKLGGYLRD